MNFYEYCEHHGIELLNDDIKFIKKKISGLNGDQRSAILNGYIKTWRETLSQNEDDLLRHNKARKAANMYLINSK